MVDFTAWDVLRHTTHALDHLAGKAANAELQALDVFGALDLLAVPAAHLAARVTRWEVDDVVLGVKLAHQLAAVALIPPGSHLAAVQAEGDGAAQGKGFILAEEIVGRRVSAFHSAVLNTVDHTESRHQLARSMGRDRELAATHLVDLLGEGVSRTKNGVKRLRKARSQAPANGSGLRMHCRRSASGQHTSNAGVFDDGTTIHGNISCRC